METRGDERDEAEQEKLKRFGRAGPTKVNKQADSEIEEADAILVIHGAIARGGHNENVRLLKLDAIPAECVARLPIDVDLPESPGHIERCMNGLRADAKQLVANVDIGLFAGAVGGYMGGKNPLFAARQSVVYPGNSVIWKGIAA